MHLGPLYYYLLALPMSFGAFDPLAEALLMVVLNALAIAVLYWLLALWFGPRVAIAGRRALYRVTRRDRGRPLGLESRARAVVPAAGAYSAWLRRTACATAAGSSWSASGWAA